MFNKYTKEQLLIALVGTIVFAMFYAMVNKLFLDRAPHPMEYFPIGWIVAEIILGKENK